MTKKIADLDYHYGLKMRLFPSSEQKRIIDNNMNASRFAYNEMVVIDKELYWLQKVQIPISIVQDRIAYLKRRKNNTQMLFAIHPWLASTRVYPTIKTVGAYPIIAKVFQIKSEIPENSGKSHKISF